MARLIPPLNYIGFSFVLARRGSRQFNVLSVAAPLGLSVSWHYYRVHLHLHLSSSETNNRRPCARRGFAFLSRQSRQIEGVTDHSPVPPFLPLSLLLYLPPIPPTSLPQSPISLFLIPLLCTAPNPSPTGKTPPPMIIISDGLANQDWYVRPSYFLFSLFLSFSLDRVTQKLSMEEKPGKEREEDREERRERSEKGRHRNKNYLFHLLTTLFLPSFSPPPPPPNPHSPSSTHTLSR